MFIRGSGTPGNDVYIQTGDTNSSAITARHDGCVELYYDNAKKFETTTEGVTITGSVGNNNLQVDGDALVFGGLTAGGLTYPITSGNVGQILTSDGAGNVVWGSSSGGGTGIALSDLSVTTNPAGSAALTYSNISGVFTYTPPDLSGYLTSYTETDPVFSISPAASISTIQINNWNSAYGWGDHSSQGYLTSYTEADTLQTVTSRGATTTATITAAGLEARTINLTNTSGDTILGISYSSASDDVSFTFSQTGGTGGSEVIYFLKDNATFKIRNTNTAGTIAKFTANGNNELYYDDVKKFETTSTGATITGALTAGGLTYPTTNGTAGQVLTSDGAGNVTWSTVSAGGGATVAGSDTQVQYNDNGSLGASAALTFIDPGGLPATRRLQVGDNPGNPSQNFIGEIFTDNIDAQGSISAFAGGYFGGSVQIEGNDAGTSLALTTGTSPVSITDNNYSTGIAGQVLTATGDDGFGNATGVVWANTSALTGRQTGSATTASIGNNVSADLTIAAAKTYALLKIQTSHAAWVTLYTDTASRTADASRTETTDPTPGSGVIAEVITNGATTQLISPGTIGYNSAGTETTYAKIVNKSGATASITVTLHYVKLEA